MRKPTKTLDEILGENSKYLPDLAQLKEVLIANAVMIGEIPSPTGGEKQRIQFMIDRFTEAGLKSISLDEAGNAVAMIPGKNEDKTTLLMAHADTPIPASVNHTLTVDQDKITGPGIADNSIGLATMASLPIILDKLNIELEENLILLAAKSSLGEGDLSGLRLFLENNRIPIRTALCLEGDRLGRLTYKALGTLRGEISVHIPNDCEYARKLGTGAVEYLSQIACKINEIEVPEHPDTSIVLGSLQAGSGFTRIPRSGILRFEVNSEDSGQVDRIQDLIEDIVRTKSNTSNCQAELKIIGKRNPGGLEDTHPLVQTHKAILKAGEIESFIVPSSGDLSALVDYNVPALTVGLTFGENFQEPNESVRIEPLFQGIAQVLSLLQAIDNDLCHE